ncbi:MAG: hypothetical protein R3266_06770, partial [Gemmatimonadota bacterium]|nr:hypothetical protein [Gemmatimonadota bacterium]
MGRAERVRGRLGTSLIKVLLVAVPLLLGGARPAAQEVQDGRRIDPEAVLLRLEVGQRLRIELLEGARETARYRGHVDDSLRMYDGLEVNVALGDLRKLWTRGRSSKAGALIGGGVGLVA